MKLPPQGKTVFVGLSGGVDSSVAASRLLKAGYHVIGVFIKVWQPDFLDCHWEAERLDAMRVAAKLKIPFLTCDATTTYKQEVADYFIREYVKGNTPNPDVMCNQYVKFGAFFNFAMEHKADFVATGHYARVERQENSSSLWRGVDTNKDQSYFLWTLKPEILNKVLLPIGKSTKETVREEARLADLPTAKKKDSQGICFLGHIDIPDFIKHFVDLRSGDVLNERNEVIGVHPGALVFTLGQRHGFTATEPAASQEPYFVVRKDLEKNTITVSHQPPKKEVSTDIKLVDTNWLAPIDLGKTYDAQFRYRQVPVKVKLTKLGTQTALLTLQENADFPTSGQSAVIYDGDWCLGGGIISV